jgi:hypothetical protein
LQVLVEKNIKSDVQDIDKKKYLVPADLTIGQVSVGCLAGGEELDVSSQRSPV